MNNTQCRVAVLGSGKGTNFEALAEAAGDGWQIVAAGSDKPGAPLLRKAERRRIPNFSLDPADFASRDEHEAALAAELEKYAPNLVVLAGYMRILGPRLLEPWNGRMLNIHPSLLPAWPGLHTHERVLEAGDREHGTTVHFVTAELDRGPRIVQGRLAVHPQDTPSSLAQRVQRLEHRIYPMVVDWYAKGRLKLDNALALLDGKPLIEPVVIEESECA
ncbi:MAG TPA: phosphoribosylglycinamide formyltransferase [Gammaproteobacteria bacterium]|nr:phosphoribosylglycinamide formyltransferase [Gammaproteobacteria bacterium]